MQQPRVLPSVEIRWFFSKQPLDLETWFRRAFRISAPETRTDHYMHVPEVSWAGIKMRRYEDQRKINLEFKMLHEVLEDPASTGVFAGPAERWSKWTQEIDSDPPSYKAAAGGTWVDVEKVRLLAKVALDGNRATDVEPDTKPDAGCNLEYTTLEADGQPWWTFGFEAFASPKAQVDARLPFCLALQHAISKGPPQLPNGLLLSYPQWIGRLLAAHSTRPA
jgi:hypothetical protein